MSIKVLEAIMSEIKDGERLQLVPFPSPKHDLFAYMHRIVGEINQNYSQEKQRDCPKENQSKAEGVRATSQTIKEALDYWKEGNKND